MNACNSANMVAKKYNWIKIDCEKRGEMRSVDDINEEVMMKIL
jgi:hypothetical protein